MRIVLLTFLTMVAFAANSVLNRFAVDGGYIEPSTFATFRVISGALFLLFLMLFRKQRIHSFSRDSFLGGLGLSTYMLGFSVAYSSLDAGAGALILFGTVQISMFSWAAFRGSVPRVFQLVGASVAFFGLLIALWPQEGNENNFFYGTILMVIAGLGWSVYSIVGRASKIPLSSTVLNFILAIPIVLLFSLDSFSQFTSLGLFLALISGTIASGLGYSLWYSILPKIDSQTAAVVQLSVPIIAIIAGALILDEQIDARLIFSTLLVVGGIFISVFFTYKLPSK